MAIDIRVKPVDGSKIKIMAALPSYDGTRWNGSAIAAIQRAGIDTLEESRSLLANVFNRCWTAALNRRSDPTPVTHFMMLHSDIIPTDSDWIRQLWAEFVRHRCKVLSVAVPIKTDAGLTSTALEGENIWRPRRLTMSEILDMPVTWTSGDLLVNTGLMLVDFRDEWVEHICFTINDKIHKTKDGKWICDVEPEDWNFSRQCRALGVPVHVTRRVSVLHVGPRAWRNDVRWGLPTDPLKD